MPPKIDYWIIVQDLVFCLEFDVKKISLMYLIYIYMHVQVKKFLKQRRGGVNEMEPQINVLLNCGQWCPQNGTLPSVFEQLA